MTRIDKGDNPTQVVSHLISARSGTIQTEKNLAMTYQSREKFTITLSGQHAGRRLLDQFSRAQHKGLRLWQTRSHAVIVYSSVPADCIYKVISQNKEKELYLRDARRLVQHQRSYSRVHGSRSSNSSSKTHLRVRLLAGNWCRERNKVIQQITQNYLASGN